MMIIRVQDYRTYYAKNVLVFIQGKIRDIILYIKAPFPTGKIKPSSHAHLAITLTWKLVKEKIHGKSSEFKISHTASFDLSRRTRLSLVSGTDFP